MQMKNFKYYCFILILLVFFLQSCGVKKSINSRPDISNYDVEKPKVFKHHDSLFSSGNNFLTKNKYGQWELYIEGNPLERGLAAGALTDSLMANQEHYFFREIENFIPSENKQKWIIKFLKFYNRNLYKHVPKEYKTEIYGLSRYLPDTYDFVAPPYIRNLYLHAATDIGHALLDLAMIQECSSAALWGNQTEDGKLLVGRNLDFFVGDDFSKEKMLIFVNPDKGIPFVSYAWPGMLGVVSGMNKTGLTITMNAGESKIPWSAKKPITIVAREILQYASTIEEAVEIAEKSEVFVSEALLVSSAKDNKAVSIEMSPKNFGIYEIPNSRLICTNHFQSEAYQDDKRNLNRIENSHSQYRFERMEELLDQTLSTEKVTPKKMVEILRDKQGLENESLGYGNEKALNQLLSHHAVVFQPEKSLFWASSAPYNLGVFTAYDLKEIFNDNKLDYQPQHIDSLHIPADDFQYSKAFKNYEKYRKINREIDQGIAQKDKNFKEDKILKYQSLNPDFWEVYYKSGLLYYRAKKYEKAEKAFELALEKIITTKPDEKQVQKMLKKTKRKLR